MATFSSYPNLTVIGFDFPLERNTELIEPNKKLRKNFPKHKLHFATSGLTIKEVASFFRKLDYGFTRGADYEFRLMARKAYLNQLKKQSKTGEFFCMLDYSSNVRQVLQLENSLKKNGISAERSAKIKEEILFLQTFERAKLVLNQVANLHSTNALYTDISLAYALHLMIGCEIYFDIPPSCKYKIKELEKMKEGLLYFYNNHLGKVYKSTDQEIVYDGNGIKYISKKESFYLMNGKPQHGFCLDPNLNKYCLI